MKPLNLSQPSTLSSSARIYLQHYGIYFEDIPQYLGTFQSGAEVLFAHIFLPPEATGTVFVLHGYCDHSGILKHLIGLLIQQRLAVAVYDLPGHGLSNGAPCLIHHYLAKPFVETIPRVFFDSSSDPEFNQFIRNDPLQCQEIPLNYWTDCSGIQNGSYS